MNAEDDKDKEAQTGTQAPGTSLIFKNEDTLYIPPIWQL